MFSTSHAVHTTGKSDQTGKSKQTYYGIAGAHNI